MSCVITGHNNQNWVGYSFIDTYFHDTDGNEDDKSDRDSIRYYQGEIEDPSCLDPLTGGKVDTNSISDPREYFLLPLKQRVEQIEEHWKNFAFTIASYVGTPVSLRFPRTTHSAEADWKPPFAI